MAGRRVLLLFFVAVVIWPVAALAGDKNVTNCRSCHVDVKYSHQFELFGESRITLTCPGLARMQLDSDLTMIRLKRLERWVNSLEEDGAAFQPALLLAERRFHGLFLNPDRKPDIFIEKNQSIRFDLHQKVFRTVFVKTMAKRVGWFLAVLLVALLAWGGVWYISWRGRKKTAAEVEAGLPGRNRDGARNRFEALFRERL